MAFNTSTNLNESLTTSQSTAGKAIYTLILAIVMILIVVGNVIVLIVLFHQRKRPSLRVTNLFLANLAIVDLSVGLLLFPMSIFTVVKGGWVFGQSLCELNGFINMVSGATSILTLAAISLDRYFAIVMGNKLLIKQAFILLGVVWFWGTLIGLLPVLGWNSYSYGGYGSICKMSFEQDKGYILLTAITCFVFPLTTMVFCYLRVFFRVRSHRKLMQQWRGNQSRSKKNRNMSSEMRTAKIVVTVLFVFAGAWTPFVIVHLIELSPNIHIPASIFTLVTLFAAMHSFCNPIVYTSMNRKFRADLLDLIPVLKKLAWCCSLCCSCCNKTGNEVNEFALEPSRTGFGDVTSHVDTIAGSIVVVQGERPGKEDGKDKAEIIASPTIGHSHGDDNSNDTKAFINEAYQI